MYFPLLLMIFVIVGAGVVFVRGHLEGQALQRMLSNLLPEDVFHDMLWVVVIVGALGLSLFIL